MRKEPESLARPLGNLQAKVIMGIPCHPGKGLYTTGCHQLVGSVKFHSPVAGTHA